MFCLFCQLLDSWAHRFFRHSSFLKVQPAGISADLDSTSNDAGHSSPTRKRFAFDTYPIPHSLNIFYQTQS